MKKHIFIWNRKEIRITRDLNTMNKIRDVLSINGIEHFTKTNGITNTGRHHGVPNIKSDNAYEYRIYVHKDDYEKAVYLLEQL